MNTAHRGVASDRNHSPPRRSKAALKRAERALEHGIRDVRTAWRVPFIDTEALSVDLHYTWRTLFPDNDEDEQ